MSEETNVSSEPVSTQPEEGAIENKENSNPEPVIPEKRKYKFKADGQEYEEEYDDESITRQLSLAKAAQKRMNEASMTRKQAESFIHALQNDPMSVLQDPRIMGQEKFRQIAEQYLSKQLEEELLSPEEKARKSMEERLRKYEEQEKEEMTRAEQAKLQKLEEHYSNEYQKTIMEALNVSSLPKNAFTVKRMASLMQKNLEHDLDLPPQALAQIVKEDYQKEIVSLIGNSDASQILAMFGEDTVNKIRKYDLEKLRSNVNSPVKPSNSSEKSEIPQKKMRPAEFAEWLKTR
jgi:hypothetical protein